MPHTHKAGAVPFSGLAQLYAACKGGNDEVGGSRVENRDAGRISRHLCKTRKGGPASLLPEVRMTSALLLNEMAYITGAADPSDHLPTGTMNTSIGSGAPLNCGFSMTGELDRSAPQTAPSMSGV